MLTTERATYARALGLGVVAGMRSLTAPAALSQQLRGSSRTSDALANLLGAPAATPLLVTAAAGELIGDKLAVAPARTAPLGITARALSGAICGAAVASSGRAKPLLSAALGAAAAVGAAYAAMRLREAIGKELSLSDPIIGLAEDSIAITLALGIARSEA